MAVCPDRLRLAVFMAAFLGVVEFRVRGRLPGRSRVLSRRHVGEWSRGSGGRRVTGDTIRSRLVEPGGEKKSPTRHGSRKRSAGCRQNVVRGGSSALAAAASWRSVERALPAKPAGSSCSLCSSAQRKSAWVSAVLNYTNTSVTRGVGTYQRRFGPSPCCTADARLYTAEPVIPQRTDFRRITRGDQASRSANPVFFGYSSLCRSYSRKFATSASA